MPTFDSPDDPRPSSEYISALLDQLQQGDSGALRTLFPLIYEELKMLAHAQRRHWHGDFTLNTTALVHEAYEKLAGQEQLNLNDRSHFFALAATAMRQILINYADLRRAQKRGGNATKVSYEDLFGASGDGEPLRDHHLDEVLSLDRALRQLEQRHERPSKVVECRIFAGMTIEETATVLNISRATVSRDWETARLWLTRAMQDPIANANST